MQDKENNEEEELKEGEKKETPTNGGGNHESDWNQVRFSCSCLQRKKDIESGETIFQLKFGQAIHMDCRPNLVKTDSPAEGKQHTAILSLISERTFHLIQSIQGEGSGMTKVKDGPIDTRAGRAKVLE